MLSIAFFYVLFSAAGLSAATAPDLYAITSPEFGNSSIVQPAHPPGAEARRQRPPSPTEPLQNQLGEARSADDSLLVYERNLPVVAIRPGSAVSEALKAIKSLRVSESLEERRLANEHNARFLHLRTSDPDSAAYFGQKAAGYFEKHADIRLRLNIVNNLLRFYLENQYFTAAEELVLDSISYVEKLLGSNGDEDEHLLRRLQGLYDNAGIMYSRVRAYDEAALMHQRAVELSDNPALECNAKMSLAFVLLEMDMAEEATAGLRECLGHEHFPPALRTQLHIVQHRLFNALGDSTGAIELLHKTLPLAMHEASQPSQLLLIYSYLTNEALDREDVEEAAAYAEHLLSSEKELRSPDIILFVNFTAARYLYKTERYEEALTYARRVTDMFERNITFQHDYADGIYAIKAGIYERLGDIDAALAAYVQQTELFNRIEIKERELAREKAQVRYQLRLNEASLISALQAKEASGIRVWILSAVAFSVFLLLLFVGIRYRKSRTVIDEKQRALSEAEQENDSLKENLQKQVKAPGNNAKPAATDPLIQFQKKVILPADTITYIQSDGNYVKVHSLKSEEKKASVKIIRMTLKACAEKLPAEMFRRIHRQIIINTAHVDRIENDTVYMKTGEKFQAGKSYKKNLDFDLQPEQKEAIA